MKALGALFLVCLLVFMPFKGVILAEERKELWVAATGELFGKVGGKVWPWVNQAWGLVHIAPILQELQRQPHPLVLVDGGNSAGVWSKEGYSLAEEALSWMKKLGYTALVVGGVEANFSSKERLRGQEVSGFPWLLSNGEKGKGSYSFSHVVKKEGLRVGLLGVAHPEEFWSFGEKKVLLGHKALLPLVKTGAKRLREEERADLVLLILHGELKNKGYFHQGLQTLVERAKKDVDVVVFGKAKKPWRQGWARPPVLPHSLPVLEAAGQGKGVALLKLKLGRRAQRWKVLDSETWYHQAQYATQTYRPLEKERKRIAWLSQPTGLGWGKSFSNRSFQHCAKALLPLAALPHGASKSLVEPKNLFPKSWKRNPLREKEPILRGDVYGWFPYPDYLINLKLSPRLLLGWLSLRKNKKAKPNLHPKGFSLKRKKKELKAISVHGMEFSLVSAPLLSLWTSKRVWEKEYPWLLPPFQGKISGLLNKKTTHELLFEYLSQNPPPSSCKSVFQPLPK